MGNQKTKAPSCSSDRSQQVPGTCSPDVKEAFVKILSQVGQEGEHALHRRDFLKLCQNCPVYGNRLFTFIVGHSTTGAEHEGLDIEHWSRAAEHLLLTHHRSMEAVTYVKVFNLTNSVLSESELVLMLQCCYTLAFFCAGDSVKDMTEDDSCLLALKASLGMSSKDSTITADDFVRWCHTHCNLMFHGMHGFTIMILTAEDDLFRRAFHNTRFSSRLLSLIKDHSYLLRESLLWLLTTTLPKSYIPYSTDQAHDPDGSIASCFSLTMVTGEGGWHNLYNSNEQGLSLNRFEHHVFSYKGPTVTLLTFGSYTFAIASDSEWREHHQRYGGMDCMLIEVRPQYKVVVSGANMLYLNIRSRTFPKGLKVGKDPRTIILEIDEGFSYVTHYGVQHSLSRVEVWGCGDSSVKEAQVKQKQWEHMDVEKHRNRKLHLEDWADSPDRQLLSLAGVETDHAKR